MEKELAQTIFDTRIPKLVGRISKLATQNSGDELKSELVALLGDETYVQETREAISRDLLVHDLILQHLGTTLAKRLMGTDTERAYSMIVKCPSCADSGTKRPVQESKRVQEKMVKEYICEADFQEGSVLDDLVKSGFSFECQHCGDALKVTNTSNIIYPQKEGPVHSIVQRVKSAGRYCDKLVDRIYYDKNNPKMKKRSLFDRYAFTVVVNHPNKMRGNRFEAGLKKKLGMSFKDCHHLKRFYKVKSSADIGDLACYAIFEFFRREFGVDPDALQDNIRFPRRRTRKDCSGIVELYKVLQFEMCYQGVAFEARIITRDTYERQMDRKSALHHDNYSEIETRRRQETLYDRIPEAEIVRNALLQIFSNGNPKNPLIPST